MVRKSSLITCRIDQLLRREVFEAVLKPADVPESCPAADGFDRVASQLGDHLHRHQVGVGTRQLFQQALVALHHPLRVGDGGVDKRLDLAAADGDAEGIRHASRRRRKVMASRVRMAYLWVACPLLRQGITPLSR